MSTKTRPTVDGDKTIAIIGLGARLPGAMSVDTFWSNVQNKVYAIEDNPPADRWDPELYYDPDPDAPDKTYSKLGGWTSDFEFDRKRYRIPPMVIQSMDPTQTMALETVHEALDDSGYLDKDFDRENCAVILGNAMGGDLRDRTNLRVAHAEFDMVMRQVLMEMASGKLSQREMDQLAETVEKRFKGMLPTIDEDSMPGELANVVAGRVASQFNLRGPNYISDAACASSLAAVEQAVRGLQLGTFDMAVSGGVDRCMGAPTFVKFAKIGALSPDGSRPFDADANGFVMGEGGAILILKRLNDAIRDGDNIYATIRGVGASSDGRGKGITAPNPTGQQLAYRRAYQDAGYGPKTVTLLEAHGTSTPVGDPSEINSLITVFEQDDTPLATDEISIGSLKSMIGHLKAAAGAASMVKTALALKHGILPPTLNVETPNPKLNLDNAPFRIQHDTEPWDHPAGVPRRAGVSAFGFGGTNFHVTMEEWQEDGSTARIDNSGQKKTFSTGGAGGGGAQASVEPHEDGILTFTGDSTDAVAEEFAAFAADFEENGLAATTAHRLPLESADMSLPQGGARLAISYTSKEGLQKQVERTTKAFDRGRGWRILANQGIYLGDEVVEGKIAMLFPGQGTQYTGMLAELKRRYPVVQDTFDEADEIMGPVLGRPLSDIIFPDESGMDEEEAREMLKQTENTQPAVLTVDIALLRLLQTFGVEPDMVAGHSLGEYGACVAAGVMSFPDALRTVAQRGTQMAKASPLNGDNGLMASIPEDADTVQAVLDRVDGYVVCANKNCPRQTIIAGLTKPVEEAVAIFEDEGNMVHMLEVSHAFHSKVVAEASEPLREHLDQTDIFSPSVDILTNVTGGFYPKGDNAPDEIRDLLAEQVASPVEFIKEVDNMYDSGARIFVECGPKRAQTSFVDSILSDKEFVSMYTNHPKDGDVGSIHNALARLWSIGAWTDATRSKQPSQTVTSDTADESHTESPVPSSQSPDLSRTEVLDTMLAVLCDKTGYDPDEIEFDFELEADLGIDTVKQAEIMADVREGFSLPKDEDFRLADYPTLEKMADYVLAQLENTDSAPAEAATETAETTEDTQKTQTETQSPVPSSQSPDLSRTEVLDTMLAVLCDKTGYDPDEIEFDFELEADLGIDTVKQAEIMADVRDGFSLPKDEDFRLADYPTLEKMADYVLAQLENTDAAPADAKTETAETTEDIQTETEAPAPADQSPVPTPQSPALSRSEVLDTMLTVLCDKTGYDPDEIEFDFELEADLGIDTVKQAEIMADVREGFSLPKDEDFRLADYPTLEKMADYVLAQLENTDSAPAEAKTETAETTEDIQTETEDTDTESQSPALSRSEVLDTMLAVLCDKTGYDPDEIEVDFELEADLGIDTVKQAEIMADVREGFSLPKDEDFRLADYPTLDKMADYVLAKIEEAGTEPQSSLSSSASRGEATAHLDAPEKAAAKTATTSGSADNDVSVVAQGEDEAVHTEHSIAARISITGSALGLPGSDELFDGEAVERLLSGQNMIGDIPREIRQEIVDKHITRLQKHKDGGGELVEVEDIEEVLKLAGQGGDFDLEEDWGISKRMVEQLDKTSQMAIAAGFNALRDAGLPLVPRYRETRSGKKLTIGWQLPEDIGKDTGVIFASAFAGADALAEEIKKRYTEEDYQFNHRFLVRVLGIANARFAEMIGARGPNTRMNNACASTTTAIGMAEDWIKTGRCKRVVIVSADDASGEHLMDWVGSGFLATGAATTEADVEKAALPFDKRRHGMIIGMGAMSLVIEQGGLAEERGIEPLVDVLGTHFVNSAYHPTRLDVGHIAGEVGELLGRVEGDFDLSREDIAERTVFVSHETYTPARGGSADAEISALRDNFGDAANKVVIANTKGFTGHAMGAGIEEVLAVKALQNQRIPHIANFQEPDPNLGDLRLSKGGEYELDYALRLAAGFGSQLALSVFRYRARTENRLYDAARYEQWVRQATGYDNFELTVDDRTLRVVESQPEDRPTPPNDGGGEPAEAAQETTSTPTPASEPTSPAQPAQSPQPVRLAGEDELDEAVDASTFEPRPVVVEAHTAATYDLLDLRERLSGSNIVVVGGPLLVTNTMVRALERCGANVRCLDDSTDRSPLDDDDSVVNLTDESAIKRELDALGRVDGVINLLGYGKDRDSNEDVHRASRATFHLARAWKQHLGEEPNQDQFFLSITGMGGRLGFDRSTQPMPAAGAVGGLTKALGREWSDTHVRVVDVAREGFYPDLGLQILAEVFADAPSLEVGLIAGVRYVPVIVDAEDIYGHREDDNAYAPTEDSVVMVVGGAKGITAEVCVDLASRFGCKLALVGRSSLDHDDPLSIDMDAEKARAKERIDARGDRVTPVAVQDELWPLKSQITIAENMERMRAAGSDVAYFSCDVADQDSVTTLFEEVTQRFGTVDGIIHAAGVEESKFLDDKTPESFDKVFCGKALGGLNLWRVAKDYDPSFFMAFSSVAGRFGNAGQVDYSSANEVLGKLVAKINASSDTKGLIIDWTAWDEVGMATAGSMRTILEHRGVEFLPPSIGAPLVGDSMERGLVGEVLVAGELGEMAGGDDVLERSATKEERVSFEQEYVFVDRVAQRDADEKLVVERVFDPERDYFLNDHVYQGVPVLPGVMGYEFMVETAKELIGEDLASVEDVSFERAVKFHHGEPLRVIATAEVSSKTDGTTSVAVKLETEREAKTGRMLRHEHFTATVNFGDAPAQPDTALELDPMVTYLRGPNKLEIYKRFFHTGRFQVMESLPHVGDDAIIGYGRNPTGRLTASQNGHVFLTDPMVREMAFQTVGLWGMERNELSYLPYKIGAARQYGTARPGEGINVRCKRRDDASEHAIAFDVEVRAQDGRLLQTMEKVELIGHRRLEASENFDEFPIRRMTVRRLSYPEAEMLLNDAGLEPDDVLVDDERESFERLISDRRRSEWLAARVAAKDLVACHLRNFYGVRPALSEIVVRKDDNGAPYIELRGEAAKLLPNAELPPTTITHSHGVAIAGIAAPGEPSTVGIDLEVIETRNDSFAKNYFTEDERALDVPPNLLGSDDDPRSTLLTLLWSVKESVSKALGLGLNLKLGEVLVTGLSQSGEDVIADVELRERAQDAYAELGGRSLEVCAKLDGTFALSLAWLELTEAIDQSKPVTVETRATTNTEPKAVTPENWAEHAAVAALLKHKGLLKQTKLGDAKVKGEDISPWKA